MKKLTRTLTIVALVFSIWRCTEQRENKANIKSLLIQELKNTHTNQEWFVPTKTAIQDLTLEQSNWKDSTENHSIGELVSHIIFWNEMTLKAFKGENVPEYNDENQETFQKNIGEDWQNAIEKLDSIQTEWEQITESATAGQMEEWNTEIANMALHTAYHTGQIIYIRKHKGWWK